MVFEQYSEEMLKLLGKIAEEEKAAVSKAANAVAESVMTKDILHVLGTGAHGSMVSEELLWRAGGLAAVNAMLDPSINLIHGAGRSGIMDQTDCLAAAVLDSYGAREGEAILLVNSGGINPFSIGMAKECRRRRMPIIAITSKFGLMLEPPRKENLFMLADVHVDNHMPYGDSCVEITGYPQKVGSVSTVCNLFIANMIVAGAVEVMLQNGFEPPVWRYDSCPGSEEHNRSLYERYAGRIKHLK